MTVTSPVIEDAKATLCRRYVNTDFSAAVSAECRRVLQHIHLVSGHSRITSDVAEVPMTGLNGCDARLRPIF
jgi:hypothetical protein